MSNINILIADDEVRIRKLLADFLRKDGYMVVEANDGEEALEKFSSNKIHLIILDVMMPKMDGWEALTQIRKISSVPVIMLTAKTEEYYQLNSFRLGVDDYVPKPFSPGVLMARVTALLRRSGAINNSKKVFGLLVIDDAARKVTLEGEAIDLTPKEYDMLNFLASNSGIALSREQILNSVWSFDYFGDLRTVDTHIKQLRSKLGSYADKICTVRGIGYRFEVEKDA
ncbi:MAG TPA: response regulator transcription factor [Oscillospiraceae bacterium]|nr:response regulator transcription factor [Oscillospiraceae bacterium]HPK36450.1 response regulator transcription factor [Oscillospiraceae bacterium]HPR76421.1 response regulator transcription factor [Oscillospiraceae bacterium]